MPVDPNFLISQLFPLIGAIAAFIVGGVVLHSFFKSDLGAAFAERIRAKTHRREASKGMGGDDRVAELEDQVGSLHGQVAELAERLDFAERLLGAKRSHGDLR
jgi:hypothetical protein